MKMDLLIPSAFGVEAVVKRQLERLGYENTKAIDGRIAVNGDWQDVAKLNVNIASGERVLIKLMEFSANTFDNVYDNVFAYDFTQYLPKDAKILVYGKSVNSTLFAVKSLCSIVKKAIVDKLTSVYHCSLDENGARYMIEIALNNNIATVTLDTSGEGLHKRGYRSLAYTAPLKETLAAALIDLSVYNPDKYLVDLFCGSGTIPIEAALRAKNIAPGLYRDFDFDKWHCADKNALKLAKEQATDNIRRDKTLKISGFDIDKNAISIARYHAKQAKVGEDIHFQVADMREFSSKQRYGVMIANPPYGERLNSDKEVALLYKDLGAKFKSLPDWNFYILTSFNNFERVFGKRCTKNRKLYNANIECHYYSFMGAKPPKPTFDKKVEQNENLDD